MAGLFASDVRVASSTLRHHARELPVEEREIVRGVVEKREREFATGRILARSLLEELDHPRAALLRDDDRVPLWPSGIVGSISHTAGRGDGLCVVAATSSTHRLGIGVDVEPDEPVSPGLEKSICGARELEWIGVAGPNEAARRCRMVFSVKEAVYKSFFPRVRRVWGFMEVEVEIDLATEHFRARLPESADRSEVEGRMLRRGGWILSGVDYA